MKMDIGLISGFFQKFSSPVHILPVEVRYGLEQLVRGGSWAKLSRYSLTDEPNNISYENNESSVSLYQ